MPQLVNTQTNTLEEVPQNSVLDALTSGKYNLEKGSSINVVDPMGTLVSLPAEQVPEALQNQFTIPTEEHISNYVKQEKYSTPLEQAKTAAEAAASGATFGLSRELESKLFKNAPEQKARQEVNPLIAGTGEAAGIIGSTLLAPEAAPAALATKAGRGVTRVLSPAAESILSRAGAEAAGSAVEAAAYGLGQSVSEHALGDADLNAENVLHNVGYASLFGGALGGALGASGLGYKSGAIKNAEQAALKDSISETAALHPEHPTLSVPGSIEDIARRVEEGKNLGFSTELPQKQTLLDSEKILSGESQFPTHALQLQSLESPFVRDYYKTFLEGGSKEAQALQSYEAFQKKEGVQLLDKFIKQISPEVAVTEDAVEGGNKLIKAFKDQYNEEKSTLKPIFDKFDNAAVSSLKNPQVIFNRINEAVPEASKYIYLLRQEVGGEPIYAIEKYKTSMPFSKDTHGAIEDLLTQIGHEKLTIGELRNIRESLRDKVNFLTAPRTANEISSLRKSLMDVIQDEVQALTPEMEVREAFKKYAINEDNRKIMERIFGGSISDQATFAKEIKPEDVLNRLFSNTVAVKAAKDILGPKFNSAVADYLSQTMGKFTDPAKNGFSSARFATFLKNKGPELNEALIQNPEALNKIEAIINKMKILPDSPSVNPSGTAKTSLLQKMQELKGFLTPGGQLSLLGKAAAGALNYFENKRQPSTINDILSGKMSLDAAEQLASKQSKYTALTKLERMTQATNRKIDRLTDNIFDVTSPIKGIIAKAAIPQKEREEKFEALAEKINMRANDFDYAVNEMEKVTQPLHSAAPNINESLHLAAARATQFLASKLPQQAAQAPLSMKTKPSSTEIAVFNRYYDTVEKPLSVLQHVKAGTLTKEHIETLQTVYPKLYTEMQHALLNKLSTKMMKNPETIPYQTKLMSSIFLGQDLVNSLSQPNISSAQQAFSMLSKNKPAPAKIPGASKIDKSNQILTETQRVENK